MNNDVELEGRPRPLSAGLWTLFSWLRREDRSGSSDSISSAGSDRTVASFAFLRPVHYQPGTIPLVLPPPGSPTDSYKKRVHDRNLRRQYDRDITLHRKYGLLKSGESPSAYDAFSLPPVRRINGDVGGRWDRDRRATSECYQRRLAHVPGKRRAPLPPVSAAANVTTSLTRRNTRKRRAPQPPVKIPKTNQENAVNVEVTTIASRNMNPNSKEKEKNRKCDATMDCKSEKYSKKAGSTKEVKVRTEKNFLKNIFDSKKRNSGIDISSVKFLPSISELDKQAAEIIETCKLNASEPNNNIKNILKSIKPQDSAQSGTWVCVNCLKQHNATIPTCLYCLPNQTTKANRDNIESFSSSKASSSCTQTDKSSPSSAFSNKNTPDEKQKLKEMLKQMKDSLPKRPKHDFNTTPGIKYAVTTEPCESFSTETPTLRVGCSISSENKTLETHRLVKSNIILQPSLPETNMSLHKQLQPGLSNKSDKEPHKITCDNLKNKDVNIINIKRGTNSVTNAQKTKNITAYIESSDDCKNKKVDHTPLKVSSLLNPVYMPNPGMSSTSSSQTESNTEKQIVADIIFDNSRRILKTKSPWNDAVAGPSTSQISRLPISVNKTEKVLTKNISPAIIKKDQITEINPGIKKEMMPISSSKGQDIVRDSNARDQHSRRRDLINQLEQSISKGDERAAAEAAVKLAQLRLSCSVLSFSSQILSQPSTSSANTAIIQTDKINTNKITANVHTSKIITERENKVAQKTSPQKFVVNNVTLNSGLVKDNLKTSASHSKDQKKESSPALETIVEAKKEDTTSNDTVITIGVLVEDREATRGPIPLRIRRQALMRDLRRQAELSLGLGTNLQRWIVGRVLCVDDNTPVVSLAGPDFSAPFYLCVVESDKKTDQKVEPHIAEIQNNDKINTQTKAGNVYSELVELEQRALVPNAENFECGVCMEEYPPGDGVVLRECVHIFCKECLSDVVRHCEEPDIPCPAMGCRGMLQEREIRALVTPQDYERWLARGLAAAESGTRNAFHCRTRDCKGWALCEPGVQRFPCPVCKHINCVPCQAIHDSETCDQYRAKLKQASTGKNADCSETDDGTRTLLNALIAKGEALECPECSAIIMKKWGCDWVKCSACKTEICWVTRGRRWGPGGKGDTSSGCRCGVDGKRCHPSCSYCH